MELGLLNLSKKIALSMLVFLMIFALNAVSIIQYKALDYEKSERLNYEEQSFSEWLDEECHYDINWYVDSIDDKIYNIYEARQLAGLAYLVNVKKLDFQNKTIVLKKNIDLGEFIWNPIGSHCKNDTENCIEIAFKGVFDGQCNVVTNLKTDSTKDYQGLFGVNSGIIKNLQISNSNINGKDYVGAIAGENIRGNIEMCKNDSSVNGENYVGGIAGVNSNGSKIENTYNTGFVQGNSYIGGIAGSNIKGSKILESLNEGQIGKNNLMSDIVGGIAGINEQGGIIDKSSHKAYVNGVWKLGAIAAMSGGYIRGCNNLSRNDGVIDVGIVYRSGKNYICFSNEKRFNENKLRLLKNYAEAKLNFKFIEKKEKLDKISNLKRHIILKSNSIKEQGYNFKKIIGLINIEPEDQ